jgi:hypothetical protein
MTEDLLGLVTRLRGHVTTPDWLVNLEVGEVTPTDHECLELFCALAAWSDESGRIILKLSQRRSRKVELFGLSRGVGWQVVDKGQPSRIRYFGFSGHRLDGLNVTLFTKHTTQNHPNSYLHTGFATFDPQK